MNKSEKRIRKCTVVELRQYTLKPNSRDVLIELFDRYFVESQEALGMTIIGQFRDRGDADRFVWLRGFSGMETRHAALDAFYNGPVWAAHKDKANETMLDSDNVLLLKPAREDLAFDLETETLRRTSPEGKTATVLAGIYQLANPADPELVLEFEEQVLPKLRENHIRMKGVYVTESAENTFKRLPVREGEHVLVWFGIADDIEVTPPLLDQLSRLSLLANVRASLLALEPTSRSMLGGGPAAARATIQGANDE